MKLLVNLLILLIVLSACTSMEKVYKYPTTDAEFEEAQANPQNRGYVVRYVEKDQTLAGLVTFFYAASVISDLAHTHDRHCNHYDD
jgi:hypothetical protein